MERAGDFRPAAPLSNLRLRARLLAAVRGFFDARGYWEVETPLLSAESTIDPNIEPCTTRWGPDGGPLCAGQQRFLQTSPEFAMKRLLAAGAQAIYQVTRAFRHGELGRLHNPEFTIVEWYRTGDTYHDQMAVVGELVRTVAAGPDGQGLAASDEPFLRTAYQDAFERCLGCRPLGMTCPELRALALGRGITPPPSLHPDDRDGWLNLLLVTSVEPSLGTDHPEFLYDYPASQAALARVRPGAPPAAERFELYIRGIEICNGYQELTDAGELRRRIQEHAGRTASAERLLAAMDAGLPECSGVALGFDRLCMLAAGAESIAEVMAFPFDRA